MNSPFKEYAIATIIIIAVVCAVQACLSDGFADMILTVVIMTCGYTCLVMGLYFYLEGSGYKNINGIDWSELSEQQTKNLVSYWGIWFTAGSVVLMYAIALLLINIIVGLVLIFVGTALFIVTLALKEKGMAHPFKQRSRGTKIAVFTVVSILAIAPTFYLVNSEHTAEVVTVEFGEETFRIQAPMVDLTFDYDDISDLEVDPNFDKGFRKWGYGTPTVCSGSFENAAFGKYTLASYTKVKPCVFFSVDGKYYAFNQASDESTFAAYDILVEHSS
jgi:hypothetical protein